MKMIDDLSLPPMRSADDFFPGGSARFGSPDLNDLQRVNNRMVNNLLYYQSNYFALFFACLSIVTFLYPGSVLLGSLITVASVAAFHKFSTDKFEFDRLKKKHPGASIAALIVFVLFFSYLLNCVTTFLLGLLFPVLLILIHSALRLRNAKNKVTNHLEKIGVKKTPMGVLLSEFGQADISNMF